MVVKGTLAQVGIFMGPKARRARTFLQAQNHMILGDVMIVEVRETKQNFAKLCYE